MIASLLILFFRWLFECEPMINETKSLCVVISLLSVPFEMFFLTIAFQFYLILGGKENEE